ncbi:formyltransferase family protein [Prochlorococcus sp. AH-716-P20]|nr:formyltransferase family protein [Prochlorococcus sp. AH-716-P20]
MTTQQFAVNTLNLLREKYKELELITITPDEAKRNKVSGYFDFKLLCSENNISYSALSNYELKSEEDFLKIKNMNLDILCVFGWNRIIPKRIIDSLNIGAIGSHSSPGILPFGRGRSPVVWSIKLGFSQIYNQLFKINENVDDGEILAINRINIDQSDSIDFIYQKIAFSQVSLAEIAIYNLVNKKNLVFQNDNINLLLPKRSKDDANIDWNLSAFDIHNLIRSVSPTYHGATFKYKGKVYEAYKSKVWDMSIDKEYSAGQIISVIQKTLIIKCGKDILAILEHSLCIDEEILSGGSCLN